MDKRSNTARGKKYPKSVTLLMKSARRGDAEAQFELGILYIVGKHVRRSLTMAKKWLYKASEQGHIKAQDTLISLYNQTENLPYLFEKAVEHANKIEKEHFPQRQNDVADFMGKADQHYFSGVLFKQGMIFYDQQNFDKAVAFIRRAAELGLAKAQFQLARMYSEGDGVPKNSFEASYWKQKAESSE